jgi:NADH dehydrogenase FAD-containing subunit
MAQPQEKHRVVIVGAGFAGFNAARELVRLVGATTEITVINSTDYTGSAPSPRPYTWATTSSASWSWPRSPPIRPNERRAVRSWWSAEATPAPRSPRMASG